MEVIKKQGKMTKEIWISEYTNFNILKDIIKSTIKEENILFILNNEDTTFESKKNDEKYREFLPDYFRKNGKYECIYDENLNKEKANGNFDTYFKYVASLKNNEETIELLPIIFEYYGDVVMIGSNKSEDFESIIRHCKESGEKLIEIGLTNITLVHTDYSDFIINIGKDTKESIEEKIENIVAKYYIRPDNNKKEKMKLKYKIAIIMTFIFIAISMLYYGWDRLNKVAMKEVPINTIQEFNIAEYEKEIIQFQSERAIGRIENSEDAKIESEKIWCEIYGDEIKELKPYEVSYNIQNKTWLVKGTLKEEHIGGVPYILMQSDGHILAVWHEK